MLLIPSREKTPLWATVLLMVLGLAGLGYALWQKEEPLRGPDDPWNWPTVALTFGGMLLILGIFLFFDTYRSQRAARILPADWPRQPLLRHQINRTTIGKISGFLPITITGFWEDATGQPIKIESTDLGFDPTPFIDASRGLQVAIPPKGGHPLVDLNFLPRPIFVPWQVILYGKEQIEAQIKAKGLVIAASFVGWKLMDSPEDADYLNVAAVFQWQDPSTSQLYVFEGFIVSNEHGPFPDYGYGQHFRGWVDLQRPQDFLIEDQPIA